MQSCCFTIERATKHFFFKTSKSGTPAPQCYRDGLREFRQCPAIPRCFPEAPGTRRVALGQRDPWKVYSAFLFSWIAEVHTRHSFAGAQGWVNSKKFYLDLTMGCQTPVLCGILSVKAIHLGPWDVYVISISIEKWLTKPHYALHLEGEWEEWLEQLLPTLTVAGFHSWDETFHDTVLTWNSIKSSTKEWSC